MNTRAWPTVLLTATVLATWLRMAATPTIRDTDTCGVLLDLELDGIRSRTECGAITPARDGFSFLLTLGDGLRIVMVGGSTFRDAAGAGVRMDE
jgi:hypothetical protein